MDWILVLALALSDGSTEVITTPVPNKAACTRALHVIAATFSAVGGKAKFAAVCLDQKSGDIVNPAEEEEKPKPQNKSLRWVQT
jgi:hypothetical protein